VRWRCPSPWILAGPGRAAAGRLAGAWGRETTSSSIAGARD